MEMADLNLPWLESPFFERLLETSALDAAARERVASYARDGLLLFDPQVPDFDAVAASILEACARRADYPERVTDAWPEIDGVRRLAVAPAVLDLLRTLYRREPIPMQTLNFGRGTQQAPHSDSMHFSSLPRGFMCGVWIALEDVDERNGALEYYPGSHRLPYFDHNAIGITGSEQRGYEHYERYEDFVKMLIAELGLERRVLCLRKGQALVWAANLLHGGTHILDAARSRHSQVNHYFFEGCLYYQPQRSDPFLGRVQWLDKRDVRTGLLIPQTYNGRPVQVPRGPISRMKLLARRAGIDLLVKRLKRRTSL